MGNWACQHNRFRPVLMSAEWALCWANFRLRLPLTTFSRNSPADWRAHPGHQTGNHTVVWQSDIDNSISLIVLFLFAQLLRHAFKANALFSIPPNLFIGTFWLRYLPRWRIRLKIEVVDLVAPSFTKGNGNNIVLPVCLSIEPSAHQNVWYFKCP